MAKCALLGRASYEAEGIALPSGVDRQRTLWRERHYFPAALPFLLLEILEDSLQVIVETSSMLLTNFSDLFDDRVIPHEIILPLILQGCRWSVARTLLRGISLRRLFASARHRTWTKATFHVPIRPPGEILPRYPNVDDVVALRHDFGCGVAFDTPDVPIPIRTMRNLAHNPNLGGQALVVAL